MGHSTDSAKTTRLSQFLQEVFRADTDLTTLRLAAGTMGRLVKAGGPLTADVVDIEVCGAQICVSFKGLVGWYPPYQCMVSAFNDVLMLHNDKHMNMGMRNYA